MSRQGGAAWRGRAAATLALALALLVPALLPPTLLAREAAGLAEYQARVEIAVQKVEDASGEVLDQEAGESLAAEISTLLPSVEEIETDSGTVSVDNSILRTLASRLAASNSTSSRARVLKEMKNHLDSMSVAIAGDPALIPQDEDALEELLGTQRVSTRSPFAELLGAVVERIIEALQRWWESAGATPGASRAATFTTLAVIAVVLGILIFVLVRALRRAMAARARPETIAHPLATPPAPRDEPLPSDPLAAADKLAASGSFTLAVRMLLGSAAQMLAAAGVLRRTRTRTNGELLAQVRTRPEIGEPLSGLANLFDGAYYGHRETDAEAYAAARGWYERISDILARAGEGA